MTTRPRKVKRKEDPTIQVNDKINEPIATNSVVTSDTRKASWNDIRQIIDSAPELPPLPPDAINFVEFRFRPKYKEFLEKLRKFANEPA